MMNATTVQPAKSWDGNVLSLILLKLDSWNDTLGGRLSEMEVGRSSDPAWKNRSTASHPFGSPRAFVKGLGPNQFLIVNGCRMVKGNMAK